MLTFYELSQQKPPKTLPVKTLKLQENTICQLYGYSGTFKSFIALDIALQLVQKGQRIIYVAGEGKTGYADRYFAWCVHNGIKPETLENAVIHPKAVNMMDDASVIDFMVEYDTFKPNLIIFDTLNTCIPGETDSADKVANSVIDKWRKMIIDFSENGNPCTVIYIHHNSRANGFGGRGSLAWYNAVDIAYVTNKIGENGVSIQCTKMRDDEMPNDKLFKTKKVFFNTLDELGKDTQRNSLVLVPAELVESETSSRYTVNEKQILTALYEVKDGLQKKDILARTVNFPEGSFQNTITTLLHKGLITSAGTKKKVYALSQRGNLETKSLNEQFVDKDKV